MLAGREALGLVSCLNSEDESCLLFLTCRGGNYSTDSGTNKCAGVYNDVFFMGFSVRMWGLLLSVRPLAVWS